MAVFWIGFPTIEGLVDALESGRVVSVCALTIPGSKGRHPGVRYDTDAVLVAQGQANGELLYCQLQTGRWPMVGDEMLDPNAATMVQRRNRITSALDLVRAYITRAGFVIREAVYAAPHNLEYLQGRAEFMVWDKESERYIPTPAYQWLNEASKAPTEAGSA